MKHLSSMTMMTLAAAWADAASCRASSLYYTVLSVGVILMASIFVPVISIIWIVALILIAANFKFIAQKDQTLSPV